MASECMALLNGSLGKEYAEQKNHSVECNPS
jgi:hypothetical protein